MKKTKAGIDAVVELSRASSSMLFFCAERLLFTSFAYHDDVDV